MKIKEYIKHHINRERIDAFVRKWANMLLNPRLLLCVAIAWMITNGWSYVMFSLGMLLQINWMRIVGGAYLSFLWLPFTPEKIVTAMIALFLLRVLYPNDEKTLGALRKSIPYLRKKTDNAK